MKFSVKNITISAQLAVFIAIVSQLTIPLGLIPLTGQTFAVGFVATLVPPSISVCAVGIYLLMGIIGIPVFAGFSGGLATVLGPTGGYLIGFFFSAFFISFLISKKSNSFIWVLLVNVFGAMISLFVGAIGLKIYLDTSMIEALKIGILPFILPEVIKAFFASFLGMKALTVFRKRFPYLIN
ncbi:biotin transporter BioY [Vagococcus elongatus]|uniref:Biotin transporter n=1 Tax=Vagococcus elongatus TaxID=180344 RepID=A0A430B5F2_9ENTE|nr:biotin transporter BioY [Vagococcus elongatus]RSU15528.1 hypothetical protein CBF29_00165 [Vagococcus elongatus]